MTHRFVAAALVALSLPALGQERTPLYNPAQTASLVLRAKLLQPDGIGAVQNATWTGSVGNDRKLGVGSLFSGLFRDPNDPFLTFWGVTDRGPNEQIKVNGVDRRTFPIPEFNPTIFFMRIQAGQDSPAELKVYEPIQIRTSAGGPVTGLPNRPGVDEVPYDVTAQRELSYNMDGLDTEGIVRAPDGDFWLCEEYGPSLLRLAPDGTVRRRYVPAGAGFTSRGYPVSETLPAILGKRKDNRGFESLAISKDGSRLYALLQSPLSHPTKAVGDASRLVRLDSMRPVM